MFLLLDFDVWLMSQFSMMGNIGKNDKKLATLSSEMCKEIVN